MHSVDFVRNFFGVFVDKQAPADRWVGFHARRIIDGAFALTDHHIE